VEIVITEVVMTSEKLRVYLFTVVPWAVSGMIITVGIGIALGGNFFGYLAIFIGISSMYSLYSMDKERDYMGAIYRHHLKRRNREDAEPED